MAYIENQNVFKAVNFAASMKKKGTPAGLAIHKAASYYNVDKSEVASHLGKRGAEVSNWKRNKENNGTET